MLIEYEDLNTIDTFTARKGMLEIFEKTIFIYIFRFAGTVIATTIIARPGLSFLSNTN